MYNLIALAIFAALIAACLAILSPEFASFVTDGFMMFFRYTLAH